MPSLSRLGKLTFGGGLGLTLGGLIGTVGPMIGAGQAVLLGLGMAWVATLPLPRRMRRERLEFTWWIAPRAQGGRRPDEPVALHIALRNPTGGTLVLGTPRLAMSPGLRHARWKHQRIVVPPRSIAALELEVRPSHAGRHVLHGAWMTIGGPLGLAWAPLYFPNPLVLEVQPRAAGGRVSRANARPEVAARAGRATRRVGEGAELRELRDHQPGDPFRRIAWKASARRGKLVVRETEDEAQTTRVLVVDVSASMRGTDRGHAKIDYAIELVAQAARISLAGGDRLGLVAFDARVVAHVAPADGGAHCRALVAQAMDLRAIVDEDLTDVDDETLVRTVARYFREQEGVDVLRGLGPLEARRRLAEMAARATRDDPMMRMPVMARDPIARTLRGFCRARGIPLPLRHDSTGESKVAGLTQALRLAVDGARETRTVLVVSDLDPIADVAPLRGVVAALKHRRHRLTFVAPVGDEYVRTPPPPEGAAPPGPDAVELAQSVRGLFTADEFARVRELRQRLAAMGVSLYQATAREPAAHWLRRAAAPHVRT
jgi:uncharacterized protein (DUF58 family)